ncbi:DUF6210 family protein [Zooshikella sp. RANM57]|uniref:DUF6210 family protein n=1 Tax=Zooshikella sp. RANM57 TaxID=3425863 RepID=UPI003D6F5F77
MCMCCFISWLSSKSGCPVFLNRSRLKESHDAWIYVELAKNHLFSVEDLGNEAVLTYPNSD